jgi:hypothetical protein
MQSPSPRYKYGDGLSDTSTGSQKVTHHTIDKEWLSRRCESTSIAVAHSSWGTTSGGGEGVTDHPVNMAVLSRHYGTGNVEQAKAKSHTMNIGQLRQRYGSAASYTTVHRALRDYGRHCDMSSRKNVIEGYQCPRAYDGCRRVSARPKRTDTRGHGIGLAANLPATL